MPAASVASAPVNRTARKTPASRAKPKPSVKKAQSVANGAVNGAAQHASPYEIMLGRVMNRVGEMAENISFVEREKPAQQQQPASPTTPKKKPPRKLEMRLPPGMQSSANVTFSAPFLDNTLSKLLSLQNRMLQVSNSIAQSEDVEESVKQEQFNQSAELSRIIALICAEKARQGA
ncbi:hypothetical protein BDV96DRAFT_605780 [Lophiotrema nucula]|uniref:Uncharacterized protein n=1 Tax=Lophiotrema nucula TaxID=690887 RepID=A0A6A5YPT9_9PLEO|nr:hypothetical protein BDV96DRAFT_605780 [Lophiotrema nucula]